MSKAEWIERYHVRGRDLEGWAVVHIDSRGFLGVVSDYGNYAYHWTSFGDDFKKFLAEIDWDYLYGKLMYGRDARIYDGRATLRSIRGRIVELRREKRLTQEQARDEWDLASENDIDHHRSDGYSIWYRETKLDEPNELYETMNEPQCEAFCKKVWPRFIEQLKAGDRCKLEPAGLATRRQAVLQQLLTDWNGAGADAGTLLEQAFDRAVAFMQGSS